MQVQTFAYQPSTGWKPPLDGALDSPRTLVVVFSAPRFAREREPLGEVASRFPASVVVGCSTAGEIHGPGVLDDSLVVAVVRFEHTRLAVASSPVANGVGSLAAGRSLGSSLNGPGLRGVFVIADGHEVNGSALARGLCEALPTGVPATGGLAGDGDRFGPTWILHEGEPRTSIAVGVGFYGDRLVFSHGSKGGWDIFGPERMVTRSRENVLYELDGEPALSLYKRYLGERAMGLPATGLLFPLAVRRDRLDSRPVVRTILGVDEATQSLRFAGDIPEGALAQLMRANFDRLIGASSEAARGTLATCATGPTLALAISCVGRRLVLRDRVEEEVEAALEALPPGCSLAGYYSYGEITPSGALACDLHNQTMTLTLLGET